MLGRMPCLAGKPDEHRLLKRTTLLITGLATSLVTTISVLRACPCAQRKSLLILFGAVMFASTAGVVVWNLFCRVARHAACALQMSTSEIDDSDDARLLSPSATSLRCVFFVAVAAFLLLADPCALQSIDF